METSMTQNTADVLVESFRRGGDMPADGLRLVELATDVAVKMAAAGMSPTLTGAELQEFGEVAPIAESGVVAGPPVSVETWRSEMPNGLVREVGIGLAGEGTTLSLDDTRLLVSLLLQALAAHEIDIAKAAS
jgi:hypothetical protein